MSDMNVAPASAFPADGQSIFLSDDTGLLNVRMSDGNVIDRTPLPLRPSLRRAISFSARIHTSEPGARKVSANNSAR